MRKTASTLLLTFCLSAQTIAAPAIQLPALGDAASSYVSLQQEHELGRLWLRQLRAHANVLDNPLVVQYLEQTIYRMVPHSEVKINGFEFVVVDQKELNAFAVPGGIIGINYGLFLYTKDEDELSGVLAHELAHLSQRHFSRQLEQSERQTPMAIATLLASILLIATNNPDIGFAGLMGSQAASIQRQLAYSREWEREADRLGIKTLADSGLDPFAMPSMFQQMLQASRYQQRPPEFLLTHPVTESRIADAADRAEQYPKQPRSAGFEFSLLSQQAMLYYRLRGEQQQAYLEDISHNPKAAAPAKAAAWFNLATLVVDKQPNKAMQLWQQIPAQFRQHNASLALKAEILQAQGKSQAALTTLNEALSFSPKDYVLQTSQANLLLTQGDSAAASLAWRKLSEQRPSEPYVWKQLSRSANQNNQLSLAYRANAEFLFLSGQQPQALRQMELALKQAKQEQDLRQQLAIKQRQQEMAQAPSRF